MTDSPSLDTVRAMMRDHGVRRLLVKFLSPNDNSKNQVYLGGDLGVVNVIPAGAPVAGTTGAHAEPIFKAPLSLSWLDDEGQAHAAPHAQLILYPQYPEVRMSGFLKSAAWAPRELMTVRGEDRILLLGITGADSIIAYAAAADSRVANELRARPSVEAEGVLRVVPLLPAQEQGDSRTRLLAELCRVHRAGWISPWALQRDGSRKECAAPNCLGVTLESELGIVANGRSEPDFEGWEVKGHTVTNFDRPGSGSITLLTPEPTVGFYVEKGVEAFVRRYGYVDKRGREDRMNFGGIHRVGRVCAGTSLTLTLIGYDADSGTMTRSDGMLALLDANQNVAAAWTFAALLAHWQRKHARAAFVPGMLRREPHREYRYSQNILLAVGTDYLRLLDGFARGIVFYDPGIKVERLSGRPTTKRRSQFRVSPRNLGQLYHESSVATSCNPGAVH